MELFVNRPLIGVNCPSAVIEGRGRGAGMLLGGWKRTCAIKPVAVKKNEIQFTKPPIPSKGLAYVEEFAKKGRGLIARKYLPNTDYSVATPGVHYPRKHWPKPEDWPQFDDEDNYDDPREVPRRLALSSTKSEASTN